MLLKKWACDLPWDFLHCVFWRAKALNSEGHHVSVFSSVICAFCVKGFLPFFFFSQVLVLALSLSSMIQLEFIFKYAWSKDRYLCIYQQSSHPSICLLVYWNECMHAKSLHSCLTLHNSVDCSLSGSSVHGIFQARIPEWLPCPPSGDPPNPGIEPRSLMAPALASRLFTTSATWEAHLLASDQISRWVVFDSLRMGS